MHFRPPLIGVKMSENPPETSHSHEELVVKENSTSNSKMSADTKFTSKSEVTNNNTVESPDLESFAKKLGLNFAKNNENFMVYMLCLMITDVRQMQIDT
jgi:hypothetical protein